MTPNQKTLLVELLYRLHSYRNAVVMYALLEAQADVEEFKISIPVLSDRFAGRVSVDEVRKAIRDLKALGLVTTRAYPNLKTYFTVDRAAVLELLAQPLPDMLPAIRERDFAFLPAWREAVAAGHQPSAAGTPTTA
jgi:hypothetical protein